MKLGSVRALKLELAAQPLGKSSWSRKLAAELTSLSRKRRAPAGEDGQLALGIKGKKGNYKLAIRVQAWSPGLGLIIESIRQRAKGEIDVRNVGRVRRQQWHRHRNRPLRIGGSVGPKNRSYGGTLGCFVAAPGGAAEDAWILSNNHVLADENRLPIGTPILQPARLDDGRPRPDAVGTLACFIPLRRGVNRVDAAIADIDEGIAYYYNWLEGLGPISGVRDTPLEDGEIVYKVGRTTGLTEGRVSAIEVDRVRVEYDTGVLRFDGQIEIEPSDNRPFSLSGDSGSLIVDGRRRAIGLLFAGNDVDATYASPIQGVLDALRVDLVF